MKTCSKAVHAHCGSLVNFTFIENGTRQKVTNGGVDYRSFWVGLQLWVGHFLGNIVDEKTVLSEFCS